MKAFFITIDTEGDSLWNNPNINDIKTENVLWIPRFQELCEKYGFIPIWLTDYEIIKDKRFVEYIKEKNKLGLCEVGIHVHARNNPPLFTLDGEIDNAGAYLVEYPYNIMKDKFIYLKDLLEEKLDCKIVTHRAGRWALNEDYIRLLEEVGIKYDCSVTPGLDWSNCFGITPNSKGSDNTSSKRGVQRIGNNKKIIEYPVSIYSCEKLILPNNLKFRNLLKCVYHYGKHSKIWLRPNSDNNLNEMKYILDKAVENNEEYVEFMIHSSELMPGGSPNFTSNEAIEELYVRMNSLFEYAIQKGFRGYTFNTWESERN